MKKWILSALVLCASVVNAATVPVLEAELPLMTQFRSMVDTRFYMDKDTREGFVQVAVFEERFMHTGGWDHYDPYGRRYPAPRPTPVPVLVYENTVKVDGLVLIGDKVIYQGVDGEVDCGTLGVSRVLKRPTIFLSGKCTLDGRVVRTRMGDKVVVTMKTK